MSFHPLFSYAGIRWFLCIFWYHPTLLNLIAPATLSSKHKRCILRSEIPHFKDASFTDIYSISIPPSFIQY